MYHHSKVARRRRPARQFAMGASGSRQSSLPGPEPWENGGPAALKRTTRRLPYCVTGLGAPLHRDRVSYGTICHVLATSLYDGPAAGVCGDAPAGLDEHPEHGL